MVRESKQGNTLLQRMSEITFSLFHHTGDVLCNAYSATSNLCIYADHEVAHIVSNQYKGTVRLFGKQACDREWDEKIDTLMSAQQL